MLKLPQMSHNWIQFSYYILIWLKKPCFSSIQTAGKMQGDDFYAGRWAPFLSWTSAELKVYKPQQACHYHYSKLMPS